MTPEQIAKCKVISGIENKGWTNMSILDIQTQATLLAELCTELNLDWRSVPHGHSPIKKMMFAIENANLYVFP